MRTLSWDIKSLPPAVGRLDGLAADDLEAVALQRRRFERTGGEKDHFPHPQVQQDLRADAVVAKGIVAVLGAGVAAVAVRQPGRAGVADEHRHAGAVVVADGAQSGGDIVATAATEAE